jgi:hypothetical protein
MRAEMNESYDCPRNYGARLKDDASPDPGAVMTRVPLAVMTRDSLDLQGMHDSRHVLIYDVARPSRPKVEHDRKKVLLL